MRKKRLQSSVTNTSPPSKSSAVTVPHPDRGILSSRDDNSQIRVTSSSRRNRNLSNIEFKLQLAKKEAQVEIRLDNIPTKAKLSPTLTKVKDMESHSPTKLIPLSLAPAHKQQRISSPILKSSLQNPIFYSTQTGLTKGNLTDEEFAKLKFFGELIEVIL